MDERDRQMRERDWRRSERYGRGGDDDRSRPNEDRSFGTDQTGYGGEDRVFGERETGANYTRGTGVRPGGGAYGAGGSYGGGQSYGRGAGGGRPGYGGSYSGGGDRPAWQDRDYGGTSPGFTAQDYTQGGPDYGDSRYGDDYRRGGGAGYGRGYDAQRQGSAAYGRPYGGGSQRMASGGTGGYDYERGYGDADRGDQRTERTERFEDAGRSAGEFLHRAGERVASWFGGGDRDDRGYREDYGRERREMDRGHRGLGPKGYKRSDERINEEAHDRLTDDPWLDASNVSISVSGGEVTLSGTVESREAKHRAERLVEELAGVNHVQNNLRIAKGSFLTSPTSGFGDSVLESQMRQDDPSANGTGGAGGGQSTAGRKS
jgi:osmotically-inducible protein OsmY